MKKFGVLGGTFDPIHYGHISIAECALKEFGLDEVFIMPNHIQPFKVGRKVTDSDDRVNMIKLAIEKRPDLRLVTLEAFTDSVSYSYKTMSSLKDRFPACRFYFILGTDSFLSIENWYKGESFIREFPIIVGQRPGYKVEETKQLAEELRRRYNADINMLSNNVLHISSTEIKENVRLGKSISRMVPGSVERYIFEHGLYR